MTFVERRFTHRHQSCLDNICPGLAMQRAISKNPVHLELDMQLLSPYACPAVIVQADSSGAEKEMDCLHPEASPLRPWAAVVVESGKFSTDSGKLFLLLEKQYLDPRNAYNQSGRTD